MMRPNDGKKGQPVQSDPTTEALEMAARKRQAYAMRLLARYAGALDRYTGERPYDYLPIDGPGLYGRFVAIAAGEAVKLEVTGLSPGHATSLLRAATRPQTVLLDLDPEDAEIVMLALSAWRDRVSERHLERFLELRARLVSRSGDAASFHRLLAQQPPTAKFRNEPSDLDTIGRSDILDTTTDGGQTP